MFKKMILVLLGGGIGAVFREGLMTVVAPLPGGYPMPIFIANMLAAFLIGIVTGLAVDAGIIRPGAKLLIATGMMGGLSTFSSFIWGTEQMLMQPGERTTALVYLVLSLVLGFLLVEAGLWIGARLIRSRAEKATAVATKDK